MSDASAVVARAWAEGLAPEQALTVSQWADAHRVLTTESSAEPGPWRTARTPYLRAVMDALSSSASYEEVVFVAGSQVAKTECGNNWIGYVIEHSPGPGMVVAPTVEMGKRWSRQRLDVMLRAMPRLAARVAVARARSGANSTLIKEFRGGLLIITGANSAASLRQMPVRYLFLDEVDAYPLTVEDEGNPIELARKRTATFARRKVFLNSTPTIEGLSSIWAELAGTDHREYHVPCPHCGHYQVLVWERMQIDSATYLCAVCEEPIGEHAKGMMLARGQWIARHPERASRKRVGFHLPALYSPLGWYSWAEACEAWRKAKTAQAHGDERPMQVFTNTVLGLPWKGGTAGVSIDALRKGAHKYATRTVPFGGLVLVAGVDVQGNRLEILIWAFGRGEEQWLIDWHVVYGDPALPDVWRELDEYLLRPIRHASGIDLRIRAAAIDSGGHHTHEVYAFCRARTARHVIAIKGIPGMGRAVLGKPTQQDISHRGARIKHGINLWPVGVDAAKVLLFGRFRVATAGPGYVHFPADISPDLYEQLASERLVTTYVGGRPRARWVKDPSARNEALDCSVYALAAAHHLGLHRFRARDWDALERLIQPRTGFLFPPPDSGAPNTPAAEAAPAEAGAVHDDAPPPASSPAPADAAPANTADSVLPRPRATPRPAPRRKGFIGRY